MFEKPPQNLGPEAAPEDTKWVKERERNLAELEIMKTPEIVVQSERGSILMSAINKGCDPEWGNRSHKLAKLTERYFSKHPLGQEIKDTAERLKNTGIDEESLYYLSLTYQHPERAEAVFNVLIKNKEIKNPQKAQQELLKYLDLLDSDESFRKIKETIVEYTEEDAKKRKNRIEESQEIIDGLINFFRPKAVTSKIERLNLMPTDFLYPEKLGKSFMLGKEVLVLAPEDDPDGQSHEFLHSIINPIVDKLGDKLSESQKEKITGLTSGKVKHHYGADAKYYDSHLCEGFIRTYINLFEKGKNPLNYGDFQKLISQEIKNEEQFQEVLSEDKVLNYKSLGITNFSEFKNKLGYFFGKYERDKLQEIMLAFYGNYKKECGNKPGLTFEDFVLEEFPKMI